MRNVNGYTKKEQLEEFETSLQRTLRFAQHMNGYAYPKELLQFVEPLRRISSQLDPILIKYFKKDWDLEEAE